MTHVRIPDYTVDEDGTTRWYNAVGERHRDNDEPAVIYTDGTRHWLQHDVFHRDNDKPALIVVNQNMQWYFQGKRHRLCGPALIDKKGSMWYIHGTSMSFEKWCDKTHKTEKEKALLLLKYS